LLKEIAGIRPENWDNARRCLSELKNRGCELKIDAPDNGLEDDLVLSAVMTVFLPRDHIR